MIYFLLIINIFSVSPPSNIHNLKGQRVWRKEGQQQELFNIYEIPGKSGKVLQLKVGSEIECREGIQKVIVILEQLSNLLIEEDNIFADFPDIISFLSLMADDIRSFDELKKTDIENIFMFINNLIKERGASEISFDDTSKLITIFYEKIYQWFIFSNKFENKEDLYSFHTILLHISHYFKIIQEEGVSYYTVQTLNKKMKEILGRSINIGGLNEAIQVYFKKYNEFDYLKSIRERDYPYIEDLNKIILIFIFDNEEYLSYPSIDTLETSLLAVNIEEENIGNINFFLSFLPKRRLNKDFYSLVRRICKKFENTRNPSILIKILQFFSQYTDIDLNLQYSLESFIEIVVNKVQSEKILLVCLENFYVPFFQRNIALESSKASNNFTKLRIKYQIFQYHPLTIFLNYIAGKKSLSLRKKKDYLEEFLTRFPLTEQMIEVIYFILFESKEKKEIEGLKEVLKVYLDQKKINLVFYQKFWNQMNREGLNVIQVVT